MKAFIFAYKHSGKTYYAEGYDENEIRKSLEDHLNLESGSLRPGRKPSYHNELKKIWDRNNKDYSLTLTKNDTSSEEELKRNKRRQHTLYELDLLLREDKDFLSGVNDLEIIDIVDPSNPHKNVINNTTLYPNTGHVMCHSNAKNDPDVIYRFRKITDAYWHVRRNLFNNNIHNAKYKRTELTNLEMCDSWVAGFGNPTDISINAKSDRSFPIELTYKNNKSNGQKEAKKKTR